MMTLAYGGSGSGKSAWAESRAVSLAGGKKLYYIATMRIFDEEGRKKAERHQRLRDGKGFFTIEQPVSVENALQKMEKGEKTALLECLSNLTANEMFPAREPETEDAVVETVCRGIAALKGSLTHFVVVSNNVFEDGREYDETTMAYIRALGRVNERLAAMADEVVEVVCGIPLTIRAGNGEKGEERCTS